MLQNMLIYMVILIVLTVVYHLLLISNMNSLEIQVHSVQYMWTRIHRFNMNIYAIGIIVISNTIQNTPSTIIHIVFSLSHSSISYYYFLQCILLEMNRFGCCFICGLLQIITLASMVILVCLSYHSFCHLQTNPRSLANL